MSLSPRRRGAPKGNLNAFKHGFYTRRIKKSHLNGVESTDTSGLLEEIALIRVFTRRLVESCLPDADSYELADVLRILCLASSTITRVIKTQYLLSISNSGMDDDIAEAIRQVNAEIQIKRLSSIQGDPTSAPPLTSSGAALQPLTPPEE